ncbi:MAG: hypothetical protein NWT08_14080 [Akkermansiaceae bacterium]|nr:hypothetical protein [Akkermansiaceae bacterium]MDP4647150.1 hypothetical protein [Akkermansiaceae bacterium]MDP4720461.1 hypothetical protein [Akkermansiaceae bacterium]MDP4780444.1 hypothetical protein [Akkermansiaceae bacterium]MDP4847761.1 hypothetical protein [Akkermansiaceae bacterium]
MYWKNLIGVVIFPPVFFIAGDRFGISFGALLPFFFAAGFAALWPWLKGRVSYDFWVVAIGLWMGSILMLSRHSAIFQIAKFEILPQTNKNG